jgi:hypothetical protein
MMTEQQIEIAAREYCRLTQVDPDEQIGHSPAPTSNGRNHEKQVTWPRWKVVAERISQIDIIQHCMDVGKANAPAPERNLSATGPDAVASRIQRIFSWFPNQPPRESETTDPA